MKRYLFSIFLMCMALTGLPAHGAGGDPEHQHALNNSIYDESRDPAATSRLVDAGHATMLAEEQAQDPRDKQSGKDAAAGIPGPPVPYAYDGGSAAGVVAVVEPPEDVQPALCGLLIAPLASHEYLPVDEVTMAVATGPESFARVFAGVEQPQAALPGRLRPPGGVRRAHHDGGEQDTGREQ